MIKIQIIVGTVGGTAGQTAAALAHVLNHQGHKVRVNETPSAHDLLDDKDEALLVCCSTTGNGELPRNLYPLFNALDNQVIDLKDRKYGVISLGDSGYQYFAQAGFMMEDALYMSGAKRIGEVFTIDARNTANHLLAAALWTNQWLEKVAA